jgi:hypothetical protein
MPNDDSLDAYTIEPGDPASSCSIVFQELLAWEEEDRIDKLADLLDARSEIERAHREDRELVLVDAPGLSFDAVVAIVAEAWELAAVDTRYQRFNDDGDLVDAERPGGVAGRPGSATPPS